MQLAHHPQPVLLKQAAGGRVPLVGQRKLRHAKGGVDVFKSLAQHIQRAPELGLVRVQGWPLAIQLFAQAAQKHAVRVSRVVLGKPGPGVGLGLFRPGQRVCRVQPELGVVARVVGVAWLLAPRSLLQPAVRFKVFANLVFKHDFGVNGGGDAGGRLGWLAIGGIRPARG